MFKWLRKKIYRYLIKLELECEDEFKKKEENMKMKNNKQAVSAVIGVILMVAITVAIAATVYVYVQGNIGNRAPYWDVEVSGNLTQIVEDYHTENDIDYTITLDYNNSYYTIENQKIDWVLGQWYNIKLKTQDGETWTLIRYTTIAEL